MMQRFDRRINIATGEETLVAFTQAEEDAADAAAAAEATAKAAAEGDDNGGALDARLAQITSLADDKTVESLSEALKLTLDLILK